MHTVGSSSGAFVAVFAKCNVDPFEAVAAAYQLCLEVRGVVHSAVCGEVRGVLHDAVQKNL